jgi:integrase
MKGFSQSSLKNRTQVPEWSLTLVLEGLRKPPFEPIQLCDMTHLTYKTAFLLALATGRRVSELHAIELSRLSWPDNKRFVTCRVSPSFVAKNQIAGDSLVVQPFKIKALSQYLSHGMEEDLKLCPVRALFEYIRRTKALDLRRGKTLLFVSFRSSLKTEISKVTLSNWIKTTIRITHEEAKSNVRDKHRIKAHQVRAIATSAAFYHSHSLHDVLQAGTWANHDTFTSYYLQDLAEFNDEFYRIGPFMAGQCEITKKK